MLKVIDLGFPRTGTMSLKYALEELAFTKCYHFAEIYDNPEHSPIWLSASRGEQVNWEKLFKGYQSTVYWSPCYDYLELLKYYPDAKVILTVRDPEKWHQSVHDTIYKWNRLTFLRKFFLLTMGVFKPELKRLYAVWNLLEQTTWKRTFKGQFQNKKRAIEIFTNYIEEIKSNVPSDRLLVFSVKEGWEPLCHFLNVPVPDTPFPHENDSDSFMEWRNEIALP